MGLLTPSKEEITLLRKMFEEKTRMVGVEAFYYEITDPNMDYRTSFHRADYGSERAINIIFEELPAPKTLRNLNWWDDNDETTPPIAYMPWFVEEVVLLKPTPGSVLEIRDPISEYSRFYQITEVNANSYYMINYVVKLAPVREQLYPQDKPEAPRNDGGGDYAFINKK